jgi:hypothetical protein
MEPEAGRVLVVLMNNRAARDLQGSEPAGKIRRGTSLHTAGLPGSSRPAPALRARRAADSGPDRRTSAKVRRPAHRNASDRTVRLPVSTQQRIFNSNNASARAVRVRCNSRRKPASSPASPTGHTSCTLLDETTPGSDGLPSTRRSSTKGCFLANQGPPRLTGVNCNLRARSPATL